MYKDKRDMSKDIVTSSCITLSQAVTSLEIIDYVNKKEHILTRNQLYCT